MKRIKVTSSNIASIGYFQGVLEVEFKNQSIYQFFNVPELLAERLLRASSKGGFFKKYIENRFRYRKIK